MQSFNIRNVHAAVFLRGAGIKRWRGNSAVSVRDRQRKSRHNGNADSLFAFKRQVSQNKMGKVRKRRNAGSSGSRFAVHRNSFCFLQNRNPGKGIYRHRSERHFYRRNYPHADYAGQLKAGF